MDVTCQKRLEHQQFLLEIIKNNYVVKNQIDFETNYIILTSTINYIQCIIYNVSSNF